jgi:hypothetical protein
LAASGAAEFPIPGLEQAESKTPASETAARDMNIVRN